ncbi:hypothetical protein X943_003424 [Babesia divergens]|uniref:Mitochondrial carrier protein n=1 Tax=Babesia divergens TaxID=32595 RepID=A0AAD9GK01_BABDI|nr:hypothetical protein X943_003424 [Babesia divergens]
MINIHNDRFERLKQNLLKLNEKKRKKRVGETRIHLTQYFSHVIPLATQRFVFSPIYRSCAACQAGSMHLYNVISPNNLTPLKVLGGLYDAVGFRKLWSLSRVHILSGAMFPGVVICGKSISSQGVLSSSNAAFPNRYMHTALLCNAAHLFSYPFDVAFGRLSSTFNTDVSLWKYFRSTYGKYGVERLYSGYTLCAASTALHLLVALPLNEHLQGKLRERLSHQIDMNPIATSTIRPLEPRGTLRTQMIHSHLELNPIEMFPLNIVFGSFAAFIARTVTYPLDTLRYERFVTNNSHGINKAD